MSAEKTLLDQIKDQVANEEYGYTRWNALWHDDKDKAWPIVCEKYATAKAQASCEATLKKAAENAKSICSSSIDGFEFIIDKSSITDPSNITIV